MEVCAGPESLQKPLGRRGFVKEALIVVESCVFQ